MRRLLGVIFQLIAAVVVIFLLTAAWIVFDGLNDREGKVDVALVTGHAQGGEGADPLLDRVLELYNGGKIHSVIVVGDRWGTHGGEGAVEMVKYLEAHGMPSGGLIVEDQPEETAEMAHRVAEIMKTHGFSSVMLVTDYYNMTRTKMALNHEGVMEVLKAHVGTAQSGDAAKIGVEVVALYSYVGKVYLLPTAQKVQAEAKVGMDKASSEAHQAKQNVDKDLDSLVK
jgi:uncharacterized SAM-binding protein YcdF (DUF218 family)